MNPILTLLVASALLAPAAAIGYSKLADDAPVPTQALDAGASSAGNLRIVLSHTGDDLDATLRVEAPGFVGERPVTLREGQPFMLELDVAPEEVRVQLSSFHFTGTSTEDLRECDVEGMLFPFETKFKKGVTPVDGSSGIRVLPPACIGEPAAAEVPAEGAAPANEERLQGSQTIGVAATAPYPTCPTTCTMGYSFMGTGGFEFPVTEAATSIDVIARWTPTTPLTEKLHVGLYVQDAKCGTNCWMGLEGAEGSREVRFTLVDPEAVTHMVSAHLAGPGAGVRQDIAFEVVIHSS